MTARTNEPDELRVSSLELFFDLVFVFTLTQLTDLIEHDLTPIGAIRTVLIFVVLMWMYGGYVWLTNQLPPTIASRRLLLVAAMAAFFICALAIPHAFDTTGLAFGVGYLLVVLVHAGLYGQGYGRNVWRFVPLNIVGALCVVAAAFVDGPGRYALWAAPIALQYLSSRLSMQVDESTRAGFDIRTGHFVERHGLLLIVAFGESVVAIGIGLADVELVPAVFAAAALGLSLAAALWWTYFAEDERRGEEAMERAAIGDRLRMALGGYFYATVPMLLGVVTLAAGLNLSIGDAFARLVPAEAALLGGGVALFLAGSVAFRLALGIGPLVYRVIGAVAAITTVGLGVGLAAIVQIVGLVAVLLLMLAVEGRAGRGAVPASSDS